MNTPNYNINNEAANLSSHFFNIQSSLDRILQSIYDDAKNNQNGSVGYLPSGNTISFEIQTLHSALSSIESRINSIEYNNVDLLGRISKLEAALLAANTKQLVELNEHLQKM